MKTKFLALLFLPILGLGQTDYDQYDKLISEANEYRKEENCEQAIIKYQMAFSLRTSNFTKPYFELVDCALALGNRELASKWIKRSITDNGTSLGDLVKYGDFKSIKNEPFYQKLLLDYKSLKQAYYLSITDMDLYLEIEMLVARDQFVRKIDDYINGRTEEDIEKALLSYDEAIANKDTVAEKKYQQLLFPKPNKEYKRLQNELMKKVDSMNVERLMEITTEHGWQERAWIILWHQRASYNEDNHVWNYFQPLINKEIEAGTISRNFWAVFDEFKKIMKSGKLKTIKIGGK